MKLKKLLIVEAIIVVLVLVLLVTFFSGASYLGSSNQIDEISLYAEKEYAAGDISISRGEIKYVWFEYSSYEPVILILELRFKSWNSNGYLHIRCNNKPVKPIFVSPEKPSVNLTVVSCSGAEWVEPLSSMFGLNEVIFESEVENGFEGLFSYQIKLRASR